MPWHEWRQDFGMDERCDYLANLLYRGAGLTVKDASVVPGGVRMAGRTFSENDARVGTNASSGWTDPGLPGTFDSEADGMSGYVRRVTADPGSDVRVNRAGSVIVEDNTFDSDAKALRDSEYVPRVYSKDKPDARAGYEDGGYDPARSKADEILRRVERSAKRQATKDEGHRADVARSLGLTDVAPYGMTLEPGAGTAARRGEAAPPGKRRRAAADEDAERRKKPEGKSVRRGGDVASDAAIRSVPNRAASVRRRAPRANASEPRAAGPKPAGPAIRRRRVRVSVPKAASSRFAGAPRGVSRRVLSGKGAGKASEPRPATGETATDRERRKQTPPPPGRDDEDDEDENANANAKERSALWSSAKKNDRGREAPVSALRGVGAKSAARLAALGVDSVGDLAALSDGAAAEKGASVRGLRDKARRALGGAWET